MLSWFKPRQPPTAIAILIKDIERLQQKTALNPYSSDNSLRKLWTLFSTLHEYHSMLLMYHSHLINDTLIPKYLIKYVPQEYYLRDFFTHENKFIMVNDVLQQFLEHCIVFLLAYESKELLTTKSFNTEKNILLLQSTVSNLTTLIRSLHDA